MNYDPEVVLKQVGGLERPGERVHADPDRKPVSLGSLSEMQSSDPASRLPFTS